MERKPDASPPTDPSAVIAAAVRPADTAQPRLQPLARDLEGDGVDALGKDDRERAPAVDQQEAATLVDGLPSSCVKMPLPDSCRQSRMSSLSPRETSVGGARSPRTGRT